MTVLSFFDPFTIALPYNTITIQNLTLIGTATPQDVASGKTFYSTEPETLLTGTYNPPNQAVGVVTETDPKTKKLLTASLMLNAVHILQATEPEPKIKHS